MNVLIIDSFVNGCTISSADLQGAVQKVESSVPACFTFLKKFKTVGKIQISPCPRIAKKDPKQLGGDPDRAIERTRLS